MTTYDPFYDYGQVFAQMLHLIRELQALTYLSIANESIDLRENRKRANTFAGGR